MSEKELKEFREELTDKVSSIMKTYLSVIIIMFVMLGSVIGWNTIERLKLTRDYEQLRTDFGIILVTAPKDHQDLIMYQDIMTKYFPNIKRGAVE